MTDTMCEHPNENPASCPCVEECPCRANHCAGKTIPSPKVQREPRRVIGHYKVLELVDLGREIWGDHRYRLDEIVNRMMVGVGDLARLARDGEPRPTSVRDGRATSSSTVARDEWRYEVKKELGNIIFSTLRWCDDLGLDVTECLTLAIEAQRKFAQSGRPR